MTSDIIKTYFIFLYSIYISLRILKDNHINMFRHIIFNILSLFCAFIAYFLQHHISEATYLVPLLILWFILSLYKKQPQEIFIALTLSFGISYSLHAIASFIATIITFPLFFIDFLPPFIILAILTAILQTLFIFIIFKNERFKTSIPTLFYASFINMTTIVCFLLITLTTYVTNHMYNLPLKKAALFVLICTFGMILFWWKSQITKSYKQILLFQQLDSLRTELTEKNKLIIELTEQNEQMGRLIHQDNKMLPAMEHAICEYLITAEKDIDSLSKKSDTLILEIQNLSRYRKSALKETDVYDYVKYDVGITPVNMLLNLCSKRSYDEKVIFIVNNGTNLHSYIPNIITDADFTHLLSNLLDNAFIAVSYVKKPMIQLQFYVSKNCFIIELADNGIPFEVSSLVNFGMKQLTTHGDTGGSGIGLMEIWKQKEHSHASLHIEEYASANPFTKKLSLIFNKKGKYTISTYRKADILNICNRLDLQVYAQINKE